MSRKAKQIFAIVVIAVIILVYVACLVTAILNKNGSKQQLFMACIIATVVLPVISYCFIWIYDQIRKKQKENMENLIITHEDEDEKE